MPYWIRGILVLFAAETVSVTAVWAQTGLIPKKTITQAITVFHSTNLLDGFIGKVTLF